MSQAALLFTLVAFLAWYTSRLPRAGREGMRDPTYAKKKTSGGGGGGGGWMSGWSRTPAPGGNGRGYGSR